MIKEVPPPYLLDALEHNHREERSALKQDDAHFSQLQL
jgi:hypothetical protein